MVNAFCAMIVAGMDSLQGRNPPEHGAPEFRGEVRMGGHFYYYAVPYESDVNKALQSLRTREFEAGRYNPAVPFLDFHIDASLTPSSGKQHASIQEAVEASEADGTRSILDIERTGEKPDFGVAARLSSERLWELYGTDKPSREMVAKNMDFFKWIERGQAIYFVLFQKEKPSEIFFAGVSYD
jgi:hypothetical protein